MRVSVEEERIKSALEIAMERISRLPELTPEEVAAQKEKEFGPVGEAMAKRYLNGTIPGSELRAELHRYRGEQRQIIRRAMITSLCQEIRLDNDPEAAQAALKGMSETIPEKTSFFEQAGRDFTVILSEFGQEKDIKSREFEVFARERMRNIGISGPAIRPNLNEEKQWRQELSRIQQTYEPRLESLKSMLMRELQTQ